MAIILRLICLILFIVRAQIEGLVNDAIFFMIERPHYLNYIYQINPSYHVGSRFPLDVIKNIRLVYSEPPEACKKLLNYGEVRGNVVLIERGGCSFLEKVINAEDAGATITLITDSKSGDDTFIDMIADGTSRKTNIPAAYLPGVSGKRIRNHLLYKNDVLLIQIPLNYTTKSFKDSSLLQITKPPWELW